MLSSRGLAESVRVLINAEANTLPQNLLPMLVDAGHENAGASAGAAASVVLLSSETAQPPEKQAVVSRETRTSGARTPLSAWIVRRC
jgi:hypothetical protein